MQNDVATGFEQVRLGVDFGAREALAEDVIATAMARVEPPRVSSVQLAHSCGKTHLDLHHEVVMVRHQRPRIDDPFVLLLDPPEDLEERVSIDEIDVDGQLVIAARVDVVVAAGVGVARRTWHSSRMPWATDA